MRILKVTQVYWPYLEKGGPVFKVKALGEHLARRGHRVTVLTADFGKRHLSSKSEAAVEVLYLRTWARYRTTTLNPSVWSFCRKRLREFDVVHIYGLYDLLGPAVAAFCRRRGIPYIVEPLGMTRPIDRSFRLKRIWLILFGNQCLRRASKIIATSEQEYRELLAEGFLCEKLFIRYNGLDDTIFDTLPPTEAFRKEWGISADEFLVLFLGRLIPRKGADILIEALGQIDRGGIRLVIAGPEGKPGYLQFLQKKACTLRLDTQVIFTGPLYGDRKKAALVDADVFVLPSRYENFGNAAAEAIACRTPVIVTDGCGIASLVDQRVGLVIPYDRQSLVQALQKLLDDRSLYERLKASCETVARELSWDTLSELMERCYAEVTDLL